MLGAHLTFVWVTPWVNFLATHLDLAIPIIFSRKAFQTQILPFQKFSKRPNLLIVFNRMMIELATYTTILGCCLILLTCRKGFLWNSEPICRLWLKSIDAYSGGQLLITNRMGTEIFLHPQF